MRGSVDERFVVTAIGMPEKLEKDRSVRTKETHSRDLVCDRNDFLAGRNKKLCGARKQKQRGNGGIFTTSRSPFSTT